jgi:hypothetical protein
MNVAARPLFGGAEAPPFHIRGALRGALFGTAEAVPVQNVGVRNARWRVRVVTVLHWDERHTALKVRCRQADSLSHESASTETIAQPLD